jgi:hypothetical protein
MKNIGIHIDKNKKMNNMKIILVSDTRTGSTVVYQTLIDIYGVDNVLKINLDSIYNKLEIKDSKLILSKISSHHSISNNINKSDFRDAKFVFTIRDKYEQILSGIRTKYKHKKTIDIDVDLVVKHFKDIIDTRIKNYSQHGFNKMAGLHNHYVFFLEWLEKIQNNNLDNVLLLPYHLFNNNFNYLFKEYEKFFGQKIEDQLKIDVSENRSRNKNLEISNKMDNFSRFDKTTNIHGLHVSSVDYKDIRVSEIYQKTKELIDSNMKDANIIEKFKNHQKFDGVKYDNDNSEEVDTKPAPKRRTRKTSTSKTSGTKTTRKSSTSKTTASKTTKTSTSKSTTSKTTDTKETTPKRTRKTSTSKSTSSKTTKKPSTRKTTSSKTVRKPSTIKKKSTGSTEPITLKED